MNYIILWVTARFSKEPTTFLKLVLGALIGAIYAAIVFFPSLRFLYTFLFKILLSLIIIVVSFYPHKVRQFLKVLSIFYIVSFVFGGAAFGIFYFTNFNIVISNGIFYISNFPLKILIISSIFSYIVIRLAWTAIQNKISKENMLTIIDVYFEGHKINLKALIDTANSLYDPISKYPVIIVEFDAVKNMLPDDLKEVFINSKEDDLLLISNIISNSVWASRFRLIPFTSLGKENGMLIGFKPDEVLIYEVENIKHLKDIIIGIYNKKLSKDETYSALMHPEVINL